jgi:hypothetical protein
VIAGDCRLTVQRDTSWEPPVRLSGGSAILFEGPETKWVRASLKDRDGSCPGDPREPVAPGGDTMIDRGHYGCLTRVIVALGMLNATASFSVPVPRSQDSRRASPQFQQCGQEKRRPGKHHDSGARDCLWEAYQAGRPAEFTTVVHTVEGDPITYRIRNLGPNQVELFIDSRDRFGTRGQFTHSCRGMERTGRQDKSVQPKPSAGAEKYSFKLTGCAGRSAEVYVP